MSQVCGGDVEGLLSLGLGEVSGASPGLDSEGFAGAGVPAEPRVVGVVAQSCCCQLHVGRFTEEVVTVAPEAVVHSCQAPSLLHHLSLFTLI